MSQRNDKMANLLKELGAQFLEREGNNTSLITVTNCTVSPDLKRATLFITVLPDDKEASALEFVKRKRSDLRNYFKENVQIKNIPFVEVGIDKGEKNRQKIEKLLKT